MCICITEKEGDLLGRGGAEGGRERERDRRILRERH